MKFENFSFRFEIIGDVSERSRESVLHIWKDELLGFSANYESGAA